MTPDGKIFILTKLAPFTVKHFAKYLLWITNLKFLKDILKESHFSKIEGCRRIVTSWTPVQISKTLTANLKATLWNIFFQVTWCEEQLIFILCLTKSIFCNIHLLIKVGFSENMGKKVLGFYLFFIWMKRFCQSQRC